MSPLLFNGLITLNQILTAGIAITAFSLLLYALTFNLRDRVARSFAIIMLCVVVVFTGEALGSTSVYDFEIDFWLRFQWIGIVFLPSAYPHLSDALLATTGRPSRGRRRILVRVNYGISAAFLVALPLGYLVGPLNPDGQPAPHLERTSLTWIFTVYYTIAMLWAMVNFLRAYWRTGMSTSKRRIRYLIAGATAPALGSFPYLLFGSDFAASHMTLFWILALIANLLVTVLIVVMAYAVAFFGVSWPDRVVKSRLFKWLMRGPVTASTVLALTTTLRRAGKAIGIEESALFPVVMVVSLLIFEHAITLAAPLWERWLFYGRDRSNLDLLQSMQDRLLTKGDISEFLEAVLASVCDQFQVSTAFVAAIGSADLEFVITVGSEDDLPKDDLSGDLQKIVESKNGSDDIFEWGRFWLIPLYHREERNLIGLMGVIRGDDQTIEEEKRQALSMLTQRAVMALEDRQLQTQLFDSLKTLEPQVDIIQRLRAASRYDQSGIFADLENLPGHPHLVQWVRDALSHYWGGPKLTESPLMSLQIVQQTMPVHDFNPANSLRAILKQAIDRVRPEGDRRFTAEWILYNILEMKFIEGRKVRDIAKRLAMSEADLYRKQRVAIKVVADAIIDMERVVQEGNNSKGGQTSNG